MSTSSTFLGALEDCGRLFDIFTHRSSPFIGVHSFTRGCNALTDSLGFLKEWRPPATRLLQRQGNWWGPGWSIRFICSKRGKSAAGHIQLAEWLLNGQEAIGPWRRTAGCFQPLEESLGVCCSLVFILFYFFLISYDSFVCHCGANMNKQWQMKSKSSAKVLSVWTITIATSLHCSA